MAVKDVPNPIIHRVSMNPGNETRKVKTKLDEMLEEKEARAAMRYSAAEMEKMALESENEAARLRGEPPKHKYSPGGEGMTDEEAQKKKDEEDRRKEQVLASAKALIDSGMEPAQVGQVLLGLTPTSATPMVAQGMNLKDVKEIIEMTTEKKEASELRSLISSLDKKIESLAKGGDEKPAGKGETRQQSPVEYAKQMAEANIAYYNALREIGMIKESATTTSQGEPLEVVKERHRHDEKMAEVNTDRDYKNKITEIASDIPERIGHGIAGQFGEGERGGSTGSGMEHIVCAEEGCGMKIYITPSTGESVTCPKCGAIYQRQGEVESKAE